MFEYVKKNLPKNEQSYCYNIMVSYHANNADLMSSSIVLQEFETDSSAKNVPITSYNRELQVLVKSSINKSCKRVKK